jgi:hypothetical protein
MEDILITLRYQVVQESIEPDFLTKLKSYKTLDSIDSIVDDNAPFKDEVGKREDGFQYWAFRAISNTAEIGRYTKNSLQFANETVLHNFFAKNLLNRLPVYTDHDYDNTNAWAGIVVKNQYTPARKAVLISEAKEVVYDLPAGIDVLLAVSDEASLVSAAVRSGGIASVSLTIGLKVNKTHTDIADEDYHSLVGTIHNGTEVRYLVEDITRCTELSIVREGADPTAKKWSLSNYPTKDKPLQGSLSLKKEKLLNMEEIEFSLGSDTLTFNVDANQAKNLTKLKSLYDTQIQAKESLLLSLKHDLDEAKKALTDELDRSLTVLKTNCLRSVAAMSLSEEVYKPLIESASKEQLEAIAVSLNAQAELIFTPSCLDCGSHSVQLGSRAIKKPRETKPKVVKSDLTEQLQLSFL